MSARSDYNDPHYRHIIESLEKKLDSAHKIQSQLAREVAFLEGQLTSIKAHRDRLLAKLTEYVG